MRRGDEEESAESASLAIDEWLTEAQRLIEHGQGDDALVLLDRIIGAVAAPTVLSRVWWLKSRATLSLRRPVDALAAAEVAVAASPQSVLPYIQLGYVLVKLERFDEALSAATNALDLSPGDTYAWTLDALALDGLGNHEEALAAAEQAVKLAPNNAIAWSQKGATLYSLARYAEALAAYDEAVRLYQGPPQELTSVLETRATILSELGRQKEALAAADAIRQSDPSSAAAWGIAGFALRKLRRYEEALTRFQEYTQLCPTHPFGWHETGVTLQWLDRLEEALAAYERALALDATHREAQDGRAQVLVRLAIEGRWPVGVERASEPMLANPVLWMGIAQFYRRIKRFDEAIAACDEAIALNPNDPNFYVIKYRILRRQLRLREAWAVFRQIADLSVNQHRQTRTPRSDSPPDDP